MLPRRHIRIKVFQSLYARSRQTEDLNFNIKKEFKQNLDGYLNIYYFIIDLIRLVHQVAVEEINLKKKKLMPSKDDLSPNKRFIENFIFKKIKEKKETDVKIEPDKLKKLVKQIFYDVKKSNTYSTFMKSSSNENDDKKIILHILKKYFIGNEKFHDFIEEYSIYWNDDILVAYNNIKEKINNNSQINSIKLFRKKEDKLFGEKLLLTTIEKEDEISNAIYKLAKNWDKERIALTDLILMRMAFCELKYIKNIPEKVTIDEYIEISKEYSTPKSQQFINGILDVFIKDILLKK